MPNPAQIRSCRKVIGLTQAQAAELISVDRVTWAKWETGKRPMPLHTWRYWLHLAGVERLPFHRTGEPK